MAERFSLIDDFAVRVKVLLQRKGQDSEETNVVSVEVPTVSVKMRPSVYRDLLQIGRHVSYEEVEVVSNEK